MACYEGGGCYFQYCVRVSVMPAPHWYSHILTTFPLFSSANPSHPFCKSPPLSAPPSSFSPSLPFPPLLPLSVSVFTSSPSFPFYPSFLLSFQPLLPTLPPPMAWGEVWVAMVGVKTCKLMARRCEGWMKAEGVGGVGTMKGLEMTERRWKIVDEI